MVIDIDNPQVPKRDLVAEQIRQDQFLKIIEQHPDLAEFYQTGGTAFGLFALAVLAINGLTTI